MSLLKKNRGKINAGDQRGSRDSQYDDVPKADGPKDIHVEANIDIDQVDIALHEDLSQFEYNSQNGQVSIDKLDIDFTDLGGESADFSESKLLSVNPVNPFSHQVSLNLEHLADKGYITPTQANTKLSNSFRMIKRPLLNIAQGKGSINPNHPNLIMITSSVSGEGKSYTAINLAISIAMERDKHVMLIDADVNKPSHHEIFGIDVQYGFTDLLLGKAKDISKVLYKTNIPSLSLMFAGTQVIQATELLASQAMEDFAADISGRYPDRIIIFDTPPLLLTTEASVLAPHMGQVVLVVEAEKTLRNEVDSGLNLLSNEVIMLLLNKTRVKGDDGGYGYYGYGQTS